jgi:RNA polymerase sigma-70 factor, ECF subfamily
MLPYSNARLLPGFGTGRLSLNWSSQMMNRSPVGEITTLLHEWRDGDNNALARLTPLVYQELYRAARRCMAHENPAHLLQSTALVNEVYLSLAKLGAVSWQDRNHFFAFCAQSMRHILVDHARSERYVKRGGDAQRVPLSEVHAAFSQKTIDLIALNDALQNLACFDERKSRVVELRFFAGLNVRETAAVLDISEDTVIRDWQFAKNWLLCQLLGQAKDGNGHGA